VSRPKLLQRGSRLALRIYLIGLVQFLIVAAAMEANRRALHTSAQPFERSASYVADDVAKVADDPAAMTVELDHVRSRLPWSMVLVRDAHGRVLAQSGTAAKGSPSRERHGIVPIALADGPGTLEYDVDRLPSRGPGFLYPILSILLVVGVASWLTARSLTKPLAQLRGVAREFGGGKLDVRARMNRSDEIGDMGRAFDDMADRIARLLLAERELLANVSHELRTPLARIRVALDLANESEPAEAVKSLGDITEDLAELERLVDDVLAAARLAHTDSGSSRDGGFPLRAERVDVEALVDRSAAKFRGAHSQRKLEVRVEKSLPALHADPILLRRVVDNVIDNAHKYTEDPSASIEVTAARDGEDVVIAVKDRGVGIAQDDLGRLFEPFFRADRSRTRATGGLGLGLALARRVVEAHDGKIEVASEVGKGTVVLVRLPVRVES
jgi:signal transduction histidine kinase